MKIEIEIRKNMNVYKYEINHGLSYYDFQEKMKEFSKIVKLKINEVYKELKISVEHIRNNTQIYTDNEYNILLQFWIRSY